ncbi:hypothetical protein HQ585_10950 [candidate division KSB1 bacterium]|nr:hypothetical protein [candidate division KSB1 bacterium]
MNRIMQVCIISILIFTSFSIGYTQTAEIEPNNTTGQAESSGNFISSNGIYTGNVDGYFLYTGDDTDFWLIPYGSSGTINISLSDGNAGFSYCENWTDGYREGTEVTSTTIMQSNSPQSHLVQSSYYTSIVVYADAWSFSSYTLTISGDASLPVGLLSLSARQQGESVIIEWVTESELDNLGYILEREPNAGF